MILNLSNIFFDNYIKFISQINKNNVKECIKNTKRSLRYYKLILDMQYYVILLVIIILIYYLILNVDLFYGMLIKIYHMIFL